MKITFFVHHVLIQNLLATEDHARIFSSFARHLFLSEGTRDPGIILLPVFPLVMIYEDEMSIFRRSTPSSVKNN